MNSIVTVIGATGHIGGVLAEKLLAHRVKVRAAGRSKDKLAPLARKGAEVFAGALEDVDFVTTALRGADAAFLMIPPHYTAADMRADQRRLGANLIEAVKASGIQRVVVLSSLGAGLSAGTGPILGLHEFENAVRSVAELAAVILRPAYFMENHLGAIGLIKHAGIYGSAMRPDTRLPMVATRDIASIAAEVLKALTFTGITVREILGPRDYSMQEATSILGAAIGKPDLSYVQFSDVDFKKGLEGAGISADVASNFLEMNVAFNAGTIQNTAQRSAANTTATTLEHFAREVFAPLFQQA
ncbi:MAG: NAD(P)H-binding protein [Gammaproteobacteria bacterium]|nr:NAD(P)H-binding protein [Gammaproteobacteria bacterium]